MALAAGSLMAITPSAASAAQKKEKAAKAEQRVESPTKAFAEGYNNTIKLIQAEDFAGAKAAFEQSAVVYFDYDWSLNNVPTVGGGH